MITIKDKIEQHDLMSKLTHIRKWLIKGHLVKAIIQNLSNDAKNLVCILDYKDKRKKMRENVFSSQEHLYNNLTKELEEVGKFEVKKSTGKETRFIIEPKNLNKSDVLKESK